MKNVLIIDNSRYITGASKSISLFAKELSSKYNFVWAVSPAISDVELSHLLGNQRFERIAFIELSKRFASIIWYFPRLFNNTRRLRMIIKNNNIVIVHVNDCYNMCGVLLKFFDKNIKLVYHIRLLPTSYIARMFYRFMEIIKRNADAVICCSNAVAAVVGEMPSKTVIYDSEVFLDSNVDEATVNSIVENIVYVGNILPGKGQDLAVKAFALVSKNYPEIRLRFVGKFDHNKASLNFKKQLDCLIEDEGLNDRIKFEGFKFEIEKELSKADILLNLSESESFSMVCLEALKCGVPMVASNSGGPAELFEHMQSGWLVANRDFISAASAIEDLIRNQPLREQFSREGRNYASTKFNIVKNARKLDDLYSRLLGTSN